MENAISPGLVSDVMDLELKHAAVSQLDITRSDPLQDGEHCAGFQLDAGLGLVVVRTIQAAGVEIDEHGGFVLASGVMEETILTAWVVQFAILRIG
jgi:hypothetical protein